MEQQTTLADPKAAVAAGAATSATPASASPLRDGSGDFDFLIGDWKAYVRRLPERLVGSSAWIEYDGTSSHHKLLGGPANLEDVNVTSRDGAHTMHNQTLRLYNRDSRQWSIYLLDVARGTLDFPPVVGGFEGDRGEFFDQEPLKGRMIFVRFAWFNLSPNACRMEQSFSDDACRTWETNWICELTR
jgi:hypothetical protein